MLFRSHKPGPLLSDFVENLWLYHADDSSCRQERIFPSGTVELVFNLRSDELRIYKASWSDEFEGFSGAILSGPYNGFFVTDAAEEAAVMGVHFKPGGAFALLGPSVHELADSHIDLDAIWGRWASDLRDQLLEIASPGGRLMKLEELLVSRLLNRREHHASVSLALDRFVQVGARSKTRELARLAGLSQKRFIDLFRFEVGLTPKIFHRVVRFQRVLAKVNARSVPDWGQIALNYGYFDQSHLIRDFVTFSGFSPDDYLHRLRELDMQGLHVKSNHLPVPK
jgi:AraC-like DNA-binding protein